MKRKTRLFILVATFLLLSSFTFGAVVQVQGMNLQLLPGLWYDWTGAAPGDESGDIVFDNYPIASNNQMETDDGDYSFTGTFSFTSPLVDDVSNNGLGHGYFAGGATLTITGTVAKGAFSYTGQILEAAMVLSAAESWDLEEYSWTPGALDGSVELVPVAGSDGLASGILNTETGDTLVMGPEVRMDLSLKNTGVNSFSEIDLGSVLSVIDIVAVPEPLTMVLLGAGALFVRRQRVI